MRRDISTKNLSNAQLICDHVLSSCSSHKNSQQMINQFLFFLCVFFTKAATCSRFQSDNLSWGVMQWPLSIICWCYWRLCKEKKKRAWQVDCWSFSGRQRKQSVITICLFNWRREFRDGYRWWSTALFANQWKFDDHWLPAFVLRTILFAWETSSVIVKQDRKGLRVLKEMDNPISGRFMKKFIILGACIGILCTLYIH